jgi:hypothetical protein
MPWFMPLGEGVHFLSDPLHGLAYEVALSPRETRILVFPLKRSKFGRGRVVSPVNFLDVQSLALLTLLL